MLDWARIASETPLPVLLAVAMIASGVAAAVAGLVILKLLQVVLQVWRPRGDRPRGGF